MVQGRLSAQHHPSEVGPLKRARESHRTSILHIVADDVRTAQIILPIESIDGPSGRTLRSLGRWFKPVDRWPAAALTKAPDDASLVLDRFQFTLFVGSSDVGFELTATHDGDAFRDLAAGAVAAVFVTAGIDVRRSKEADFESAAASGSIVGARIAAFGVHTL
jgi:hypothetical protein